MQVGLIWSGCLVLNRIQTLCLFKEAFPKTPKHWISTPHASFRRSSCPLFILLLFSFEDPTPKEFGHPTYSCPKGVWVPLCLLVSRLWLLHNQACWFLDLDCFIVKRRKAREGEKKKIKERIKELIVI